MKRLAFGGVGAALVLSSIAWSSFGGWAVVSVEKVSDYLVVGKPEVITFSVRQHGINRLTGLSPRLEARKGSQRVAGRVWELRETEGYRGSLTLTEAGLWTVTIESGFGRSKGTLLPWRAIEASQKLPELTEVERGRQMFASKGCVSCHVHGQVDIRGEAQSFGPDLTNRRFAADYLAKFLADPSIKPADASGKRMPNPMLKDKDIAPIVAFINSERRLSNR
jgi:mono/diheme cytochrome c family protein